MAADAFFWGTVLGLMGGVPLGLFYPLSNISLKTPLPDSTGNLLAQAYRQGKEDGENRVTRSVLVLGVEEIETKP